MKEAIVLNLETYYENPDDGIVTFLDRNGVFKVLAKGINKAQSKNKSNLLIGSLVQIEFFRARLKNKVSRLKKVNLIKTINFSDEFQLKYVLKATKFLTLFTNYCYEIYQAYIETLNYLNKGKSSYLITFLLARSLSYFGIKPQIERCINCKTPGNLCDFSLHKGGFICGKCTSKQRWTKELKCFYYIFKSLSVYLDIALPEVNKTIYVELKNHLQNNGIFLNFD
ncbi:UNVERIFIED_CONTAM: DNA repair protein RecO [Campylobacter lari]